MAHPLNKSEQEIVELSKLIAASIPVGTEISLAVSCLVLVLKGALATTSPEARARCWEVVRFHCNHEIERNSQ